MLNFNHLYYFYMVGKLGGVSAAARTLRLSQPSLSAQLKTFEIGNGAKLFRKEGRHLVLTEVGKYLHGYCRKMFEEADQIEAFLKRGRAFETETTRISFGVCGEVDRRFAVDLMGSLLQAGTDHRLRVTMVSGGHEDLLDQLRSRSLDVVLTNRGVNHPDLTIFSQAASPVSFLVSRKTFKQLLPSKKKWPLSLHQIFALGEMSWAVPTPSIQLRTETDTFFGRVKVTPNIRFESDMLTGVARAVADDLGAAVLPRCYAQKEIEDERIFEVPIKEKLWSHPFFLVTRRGHGNEIPIEHLSKLLRSLCESKK